MKNSIQTSPQLQKFASRRMLKFEKIGVQQHPLQVVVFPKKFVVFHVAVSRVADDRVPQVGKMSADLVPPSGQKFCFDERKTRRRVAQPDCHFDLRAGEGSEAGLRVGAVALAFVVNDRVVNQPLVGQPAAQDCQVFFLDGFLHDLLAECASGFGIFSKNQNPRRASVEPMDWVNSVLDLVSEQLQHEHAIFADACAVDEDAGRFVDCDDFCVVV